jgi:polyhydroxyalkanoate synthesis regulator phasin
MELNDMPFVLLGALASVRDDSIKTLDDMIAKGKDMAEGAKGKARSATEQRKLDATVQELVKKGKKESEELVDAIGKVIKDTLDSLGVVTKSDIKNVETRLSAVEKKLGPGAPAKKPARKKAAKKAAKRKAPAKKPARKKAAKKAAKKA